MDARALSDRVAKLEAEAAQLEGRAKLLREQHDSLLRGLVEVFGVSSVGEAQTKLQSLRAKAEESEALLVKLLGLYDSGQFDACCQELRDAGLG